MCRGMPPYYNTSATIGIMPTGMSRGLQAAEPARTTSRTDVMLWGSMTTPAVVGSRMQCSVAATMEPVSGSSTGPRKNSSGVVQMAGSLVRADEREVRLSFEIRLHGGLYNASVH